MKRPVALLTAFLTAAGATVGVAELVSGDPATDYDPRTALAVYQAEESSEHASSTEGDDGSGGGGSGEAAGSGASGDDEVLGSEVVSFRSPDGDGAVGDPGETRFLDPCAAPDSDEAGVVADDCDGERATVLAALEAPPVLPFEIFGIKERECAVADAENPEPGLTEFTIFSSTPGDFAVTATERTGDPSVDGESFDGAVATTARETDRWLDGADDARTCFAIPLPVRDALWDITIEGSTTIVGAPVDGAAVPTEATFEFEYRTRSGSGHPAPFVVAPLDPFRDPLQVQFVGRSGAGASDRATLNGPIEPGVGANCETGPALEPTSSRTLSLAASIDRDPDYPYDATYDEQHDLAWAAKFFAPGRSYALCVTWESGATTERLGYVVTTPWRWSYSFEISVIKFSCGGRSGPEHPLPLPTPLEDTRNRRACTVRPNSISFSAFDDTCTIRLQGTVLQRRTFFVPPLAGCEWRRTVAPPPGSSQVGDSEEMIVRTFDSGGPVEHVLQFPATPCRRGCTRSSRTITYALELNPIDGERRLCGGSGPCGPKPRGKIALHLRLRNENLEGSGAWEISPPREL